MKQSDEREFLKALLSLNELIVGCPNPECGESFSIKRANLFDIRNPYPPNIKKLFDKQQKVLTAEMGSLLKEEKKVLNKIEKSELQYKKLKNKKTNHPKRVRIATRSINIGQIAEKILPSSKKFRYDPADCRALLTPVDYIAFNGLHKKGKVDNLSFIEVKTGNAWLQHNQFDVVRLVLSNKVKVIEY